jgi:hypothetical protein
MLIVFGGGTLLLLNWLLVGAVARWTLWQHPPAAPPAHGSRLARG